jgi:phosphoribosylaminoimidazolecarboxamide formyltransferase/IMP cyclohydrolase
MAPRQRHAVLSVWDKQGIEDIGRVLTGAGHSLLSTSQTARLLRAAGLAVTEISDWTGSPEILGGRVKTIHPRIAAGILNDRTDPGADLIDFVVCNLYPFEDGVSRGASGDELVELVDIGGVTLLRAAAKNHRHVVPVPHGRWYPEIIRAVREEGTVGPALRRELARATFELTSHYDAAIARAFAQDAL